MAKDKLSANPVAAHNKQEKNKAIKKQKATLQQQRHEKLARRNPDRLQRQIADLKAQQEAQGGKLRPKDQQTLEQLERDVKAVHKARESLGDRAPSFPSRRGDNERDGASRGRGGSALGKRRREGPHGDAGDSDSEATDPEARDIPMPRDTPPPVPSRRVRQQLKHHPYGVDAANRTEPHALPAKPVTAQTTYSSAPQVRDLKKEAVSAFVPSAVAARLKQKKQAEGKGGHEGKLMEPEDMDRLEQAGYMDESKAGEEAEKEELHARAAGEHGWAADLDEEEAAFERELREDVRDKGMSDAVKAADEATKEAEYTMMAEGVTADTVQRAERSLRHVEVEDVPDEGE